MIHDVVESNVLEADLLHWFLELSVIEHFQCVAIDE